MARMGSYWMTTGSRHSTLPWAQGRFRSARNWRIMHSSSAWADLIFKGGLKARIASSFVAGILTTMMATRQGFVAYYLAHMETFGIGRITSRWATLDPTLVSATISEDCAGLFAYVILNCFFEIVRVNFTTLKFFESSCVTTSARDSHNS